MTEPKRNKVRLDRHEKLYRARLRLGRGFRDPGEMLEAVDWLFFELDVLIHEVEELKAAAKEKN